MKKIRAAVVGYGNIGKSVVEALQGLLILKLQGLSVVMAQKTSRQNWLHTK